MILHLLFVVLISSCEFGSSARILGVVPIPSYSHQVLFRPIWRELAKRGHDLVVITTDPENDPKLNIKEIDVNFTYDIWYKKHNIAKKFEEFRFNPIKALNAMLNVSLDVCTQELLHPEVQALLKNDTEYFDLMIVEYMFPMMYGFAERFKCPYIGIVSMDLTNYYHSMLGNTAHPIIYPDALLPYYGTLTFWQRLFSSLYQYIIAPIMSTIMEGNDFYQLMKDHFGDDLPPLVDIVKNVSMIFLNVDPSTYIRPIGPAFVAIGGGTHITSVKSLPKVNDIHQLMKDHFGKDLAPLPDIIRNVSMICLNVDPSAYIRPLGPAFVTIGGGTHITSVKPLPKDLQEYLDGAKNGVIYFSLGTNVKSVMIPPEMRKIMLDTFRELPYRVLWKFDVTDIPDVPENVKIVEWLPQQDILRHPNIKVFITQGGLQSTEEAIFSNVPVVGIPFIGDQEGNVQKIVKKGFGVYLDKTKLTKESFKEAILEVINNPKYKQKTIEVAELSRDQPMTGLEKAVWWTEYVIRHKGAKHFRNPAIDLPTYQYYLLDVIGFILAVLSIFIFISYKIIVYTKRLIVRIFSSIFSKKVKKQ